MNEKNRMWKYLFTQSVSFEKYILEEKFFSNN